MSNPPMGTVVSSVMMREESGSERAENEAWKGPYRQLSVRAFGVTRYVQYNLFGSLGIPQSFLYSPVWRV